MRYVLHTTHVPNALLSDALLTAALRPRGNMTAPQTQLKMDCQAIAAAHMTPHANYFIGNLCIHQVTEERMKNTSHRPYEHDGYDAYRLNVNIGYLLHDPFPDLAAVHVFDEEETARIIAHFQDDLPVNNAWGYQAVWFDENGIAEKFAVCTDDIVNVYAAGENVPENIVPVAEMVKAVTPATRRQLIETLIERDVFKENSGYDLARYHARHYVTV